MTSFSPLTSSPHLPSLLLSSPAIVFSLLSVSLPLSLSTTVHVYTSSFSSYLLRSVQFSTGAHWLAVVTGHQHRSFTGDTRSHRPTAGADGFQLDGMLPRQANVSSSSGYSLQIISVDSGGLFAIAQVIVPLIAFGDHSLLEPQQRVTTFFENVGLRCRILPLQETSGKTIVGCFHRRDSRAVWKKSCP